MLLDQLSSSRKVRVGIAMQGSHLYAFLKVRYLVCMFLTMMISVFYYSQAYQSDRSRPGELVALAFGGTIYGGIHLLDFVMQFVPLLIVLFIWGTFLRYELTFRCRAILARCRNVSVWYVSLLVSVLIYSFIAAALTFGAAYLSGTGLQGIFAGFIHAGTFSDNSLSTSLGQTSTLVTRVNMLQLFLLMFVRMTSLLILQTILWLAAADGKLPLLAAMIVGGASLLYPKILWLPIGGTMFFTNLLDRRPIWLCLLIPVSFIFVTAASGWLYVLQTDWMTRFSKR